MPVLSMVEGKRSGIRGWSRCSRIPRSLSWVCRRAASGYESAASGKREGHLRV